jgi:hypothetical protein
MHENCFFFLESASFEKTIASDSTRTPEYDNPSVGDYNPNQIFRVYKSSLPRWGGQGIPHPVHPKSRHA